MEVYANLKKEGKNVLLAICDEALLGKTLRDGKIVFKVSADFYKGRKISVDYAVSMIKNSTIINLVGNECVKKAIEIGCLHPDAVLKIEGISHAQIFK
ncbi:DUF424 family protein [Candidatus Bathyarchaeota archaeon]|nr:DUF424 family protein [Candidatus Bathyarchaeota archaeon]